MPEKFHINFLHNHRVLIKIHKGDHIFSVMDYICSNYKFKYLHNKEHLQKLLIQDKYFVKCFNNDTLYISLFKLCRKKYIGISNFDDETQEKWKYHILPYNYENIDRILKLEDILKDE